MGFLVLHAQVETLAGYKILFTRGKIK